MTLIITPNDELTLYYSTNPLRLVEIDLDLPDSIEFKPCKTGKGVFATRPFKKNEIIYHALSVIVPNSHRTVTLNITRKDYFDSEKHLLDTNIHCVELDSVSRELFPYDSFMNHSCQANSVMIYSDFEPVTKEEGVQLKYYSMISLRDIYPGEEITCNYNLFDYGCDGHPILQCQCGAIDCCHRVGFCNLPLPDQMYLLPFVTKSVKARFLTDHPYLQSARGNGEEKEASKLTHDEESDDFKCIL